MGDTLAMQDQVEGLDCDVDMTEALAEMAAQWSQLREVAGI